MFTWKHHWSGLRNDCHHVSCLVGWYSSFNGASGKGSVIIYLYTNHPLKLPGKDYFKCIQGDFSSKWMKRSQVTYLLIVLIMKQASSGIVRLCKSRFGWKGFELHQVKESLETILWAVNGRSAVFSLHIFCWLPVIPCVSAKGLHQWWPGRASRGSLPPALGSRIRNWDLIHNFSLSLLKIDNDECLTI